MLAFAQHRPVALEHPLVAPWAKVQDTRSAVAYTEAAAASVRRARPWLVLAPSITPRVLVTGPGARLRATQIRQGAIIARNCIRAIERVLATGKVTTFEPREDPKAPPKKIVRDVTDEEREAMTLELAECQKAIPKPRLARTLRRAIWHANRSRKRNGSMAPHAVLASAWRGSWKGDP